MRDLKPCEWISVDEELPEEGEPVLAAANGSWAGVAHYEDGRWWTGDGYFHEVGPVTHWAPILLVPPDRS